MIKAIHLYQIEQSLKRTLDARHRDIGRQHGDTQQLVEAIAAPGVALYRCLGRTEI